MENNMKYEYCYLEFQRLDEKRMIENVERMEADGWESGEIIYNASNHTDIYHFRRSIVSKYLNEDGRSFIIDRRLVEELKQIR